MLFTFNASVSRTGLPGLPLPYVEGGRNSYRRGLTASRPSPRVKCSTAAVTAEEIARHEDVELSSWGEAVGRVTAG